jgi:hypothetical protein
MVLQPEQIRDIRTEAVSLRISLQPSLTLQDVRSTLGLLLAHANTVRKSEWIDERGVIPDEDTSQFECYTRILDAIMDYTKALQLLLPPKSERNLRNMWGLFSMGQKIQSVSLEDARLILPTQGWDASFVQAAYESVLRDPSCTAKDLQGLVSGVSTPQIVRERAAARVLADEGLHTMVSCLAIAQLCRGTLQEQAMRLLLQREFADPSIMASLVHWGKDHPQLQARAMEELLAAGPEWFKEGKRVDHPLGPYANRYKNSRRGALAEMLGTQYGRDAAWILYNTEPSLDELMLIWERLPEAAGDLRTAALEKILAKTEVLSDFFMLRWLFEHVSGQAEFAGQRILLAIGDRSRLSADMSALCEAIDRRFPQMASSLPKPLPSQRKPGWSRGQGQG